ncbi:MAG: nitrite reductase, partial [Chloroflexi bacterium]|nr:nitrite reductase [Chloroflexota bacterium]
THPKSKYLWVDFPITNDEKMQRSVCVINKDTLEIEKCWEVADYGRAVHFEFNKDGTEVWVSVWGKLDAPQGQQGEVVVYDAETLEEIARIPDLPTATGKFNVYNTMNDIY